MRYSTLTLYRIISTGHLDTADFARREDFDTQLISSTQPFESVAGWPEYLLYSLDYERQLACFADSQLPLTLAHDAPFLYGWQRSNARHLLEVPFDRLPELGDASGITPTFILSMGRSGSTLLAQLLRALGHDVASEPDSFTSLATAASSGRPAASNALAGKVLRACVENLRTVWGSQPYVKLRGVCNVLATRMATELGGVKFVFVLRERNAWARSHARAFGAQIDIMLSVLLQTVYAYDDLVTVGFKPTLIWYEDLCSRPTETLQCLAGSKLSTEAESRIREVMSEDVQANTPLARSKLRDAPVHEHRLAELDAAWHRHRPTELLRNHGLWPLY